MEISLSILIPTINRPTLKHMLYSLVPQLTAEDNVYIVGDNCNVDDSVKNELPNKNIHWLRTEEKLGHDGHGIRNKYQTQLKGTHIWHIDDDDYVIPRSVNLIKNEIKKTPHTPLLFKVQCLGLFTLWVEPTLTQDHFMTTQMGIWPNEPDKFAFWPLEKSGDNKWVRDTINNFDDYRFVDEVIYLYNPYRQN